MEIRSHFVIVGLVTILAAAVLVVLSLWLADPTFGEDRKRYDIFFEAASFGVDTESPVRFNGVRVGRVVKTRIDPEKPTRVQVTIEVAQQTPIREGVSATILPQGITGTSYIQIRSGQELGDPLVAADGEPLPVIPARPSPLQELVGGAPDLVSQSTLVLEGLKKIVDEDNRRALALSLARIEKITGDVAAQTDELAALARMLEQIGDETRSAARSVDRAGQDLSVWIEHDLAPLTNETRTFVRSLEQNIDGELFPRLIRIGSELERVVERAGSIAERLESSPSRFLLGADSMREVRLQ